MNIYIDIETLRSPEQHRLEILKGVKTNFKAPSGITKGAMAKDLGIDDKPAKFISAGDMKAQWEIEMAATKSADVAQDKWEKTSFNPDVAPIACICIGWFDDSEYKTATFMQTEFISEAEMLEEFHFTVNNICSKHGAQGASEGYLQSLPLTKPSFIGHNVAKFDLPFIWKRSVINDVETCRGVKWIDARHGVNCFDTMIAWAGFGNRISADNLCRILNIKGKTEGMDGSKVYDTWQVDPQKVVNYCHDDVALVKEIHKRLTK